MNSEYKHVGASWLTKEDTKNSIKNVLSYLDNIFKAEAIPENCNLIIFGFSQGVSVALRWVAKRKIHCAQLVLYAGGVPKELVRDDFEFLSDSTKVTFLVGDSDQYLTEDRIKAEKLRIDTLFQGREHVVIFKGGHEVKKELIRALV